MVRRPVLGGNWKSNGSSRSAKAIVNTISSSFTSNLVEKIIFPMAVHLERVHDLLDSKVCSMGAQLVSKCSSGAHTGDIFAHAFKEVGAQWVLAGHSERRHHHGCSNESVSRQTLKGLRNGLRVILCVGETLGQRQAGKTMEVVCAQLNSVFTAVRRSRLELKNLVIAYEPVWAIGTGKTATPELAQDVHQSTRAWIAKFYGEELARSIRIIYGGSVKPKNCAGLIEKTDIDGFLLGGASISRDGADFVTIANSIQHHYKLKSGHGQNGGIRAKL